MVLLVLILILFDCLVRCSAYSTYMISLLASGENVIVNNTRSVLTINEPFTFIINSNKSLKMLSCYNKKNKRITSFQVLNNIDKNLYTLMDDIVATAEMNGTWQCTLLPRFNKVIEFELEVEVVNKTQAVDYYSRPSPVRREQVYGHYGQGDYNGVKYDYDYGAKGYSSNNEKEIVSQTTVQNIPSKDDFNLSHQYDKVKNDVETSTTSAERPTTTNSSYSTEKDTSQSNKIIMIAVVIALIGIVVGVLLGTVGKKMFCRKTSDGDPARSRRCTCAADDVYEELDDPAAAPAPAPVVDIAHRAPYPLPPAEREENKKYIHYDTPYDHRFDRPIARSNKINQHMLTAPRL